MDGWIKLHRKIQNNWLWQEKRKFSKFEAWMSLLLKANHKENKILIGNKITDIKAGSFITSEIKLSSEWNWSRNTVRTFLTLLENEKMLKKFCTTKYTVLTIENWALYQFEEQHIEQQIEQHIEQQKDIKLNTNKNDKNDKNNKKIKKENIKKEKKYDDVFNENNLSEELINTLKDFIVMRKTIKKPMTTRALELLLRNLDRLTNLEEEKIAILNQSIENSWQTVYPLRNEKEKKKYQEIKNNSVNKETEYIEFDSNLLKDDEYRKLMKGELTKEELRKIVKDRMGEKNV